ncbi:hypothetical protein D3C78_1667390 [compost metagenome]
MIGREDQHQCVRAVDLIQLKRSRGDSCSGISAEWLQNVAEDARLRSQVAVLVFRLEIEFPIGDRHHLRHAAQGKGAQKGLLQKVLPIRQGHEGLRVGFSGDRPEAAAGPAANDHRK